MPSLKIGPDGQPMVVNDEAPMEAPVEAPAEAPTEAPAEAPPQAPAEAGPGEGKIPTDQKAQISALQQDVMAVIDALESKYPIVVNSADPKSLNNKVLKIMDILTKE